MDIVFFLFDRITALDAVGPYEVLSRLPGARVRFAGEAVGPVTTDNGFLRLMADVSIDEIDRADLLVVPGGYGTRRLERAPRVLEWVRAIDATSRYTTAVCTGSFVLGAAGLLEGRRATTHWAWLEQLAKYGAVPVRERVVDEGRIVTAAGVSSGIDMALRLAATLAGPELAQAIQLGIEYDPAPPFDAGSVDKAPPMIVEQLRALLAARAE
ncbi:MAG: DJ-1/PfpI family protein [Sandaracinaceae bacterium]|nr:DJ-1/PfpI family protein [Sandaracinaceae bacterium]